MVDLAVHCVHAFPDEALADLRSRLDPGIDVHVSPEIPENAEFDVLVAGRTDATALAASPRLRALVIPWAGVATTLAEALSDHPNLPVYNLHHNAQPTAEYALALLLAASKRLVPCDRQMRAHDWKDRGRGQPALLLHGRTALIVGFGSIGRRVGAMCRGLGMEVVGVRTQAPSEPDPDGFEVVGIDRLREMLPRSHALIVAAPLTDATRGMIGAAELARLPESAVVVNVGRGPVIDSAALHAALASGRLFGAGIDTWYRYPKPDEDRTPPAEEPFEDLDGVVMSPHRAGMVDRTEGLRMVRLAATLNTLARGDEPPHRVDVARGY